MVAFRISATVMSLAVRLPVLDEHAFSAMRSASRAGECVLFGYADTSGGFQAHGCLRRSCWLCDHDEGHPPLLSARAFFKLAMSDALKGWGVSR